MKPDFKKMELIPAIIQDYQTNEVLMLAYVNEEAYKKMLETNQTYFYSRSRNELWHKGQTSGHFQNIKGMYLDCDLDTLLIYVEQIGVACHTGAYSCFFNEIKPFNNVNIFNDTVDIFNNYNEVFDKYKVNYVLINNDSILYKLLNLDDNYIEEYSDKYFTLFKLNNSSM